MKTKEIPLLDEFYDDTIFLTAEKCVNDETKQLYLDNVVAKNVTTAVLFWGYNPSKIPAIIADCKLISEELSWQSYLWKDRVLFVLLRIGAPIAAGCVEELKIFGIKNFFAAGTAGCIDKDFDESKVLIIDRAIRDEGTSFHYLPPSLYVGLDQAIAGKLRGFLESYGIGCVQGTAWTTDGFFRETEKRIQKRRGQGALAVEMECAALAAVTQFYGLNFGQFVWFSDKVGAMDWSWLATHEERRSLKEKFLLLALEFAADFAKDGK